MDAYLVISEKLYAKVRLLEDGSGPVEEYHIAQLVVAAGRSQAKWLAWKTDRDSFRQDVRDMPRFSVNKCRGGVEGPARIITDDPAFQDVWMQATGEAEDPVEPTLAV